MTIKPKDFMGSFAKGILVLEAFNERDVSLSVTAASEITGLDRATARRCLLTLAELGYAKYDGKYFSLTQKIRNLAPHIAPEFTLADYVQPFIEGLSQMIGESVSVSVLDGVDIEYIARAAQRRILSVGLTPGSRLPAYCTSMGRVLLGNLKMADLRAVITLSKITERTPNTLTKSKDIIAAVKQGIENGYVLVDQEIELGLRSLAVPILNENGEIIAALNTGVAAARVSVEALLANHLPLLMNCSLEIHERLKLSSQRSAKI